MLALIFELVETDLLKYMKTHGNSMGRRAIHELSSDLCRGVDFPHKHNVLHRDLKPRNLLISRDLALKIADFGLARSRFGAEAERTHTHEVVTVWYRAPELFLGKGVYSFPADCWSIGCIVA